MLKNRKLASSVEIECSASAIRVLGCNHCNVPPAQQKLLGSVTEATTRSEQEQEQEQAYNIRQRAGIGPFGWGSFTLHYPSMFL